MPTRKFLESGVDVTVADGGTGQSTAAAAFDALAPTTTAGDTVYHDGANNARLPIGAARQDCRVNAAENAPEWCTPEQSKSFYIESPSASEDIPLWVPDVAITVTKVRSCLKGSASPTVTWNLPHSIDPTAATPEVFTSDPVTTETTSVKTDDSGFSDQTVAAGEALRFITTAMGGTVIGIHLTIHFTVD